MRGVVVSFFFWQLVLYQNHELHASTLKQIVGIFTILSNSQA